MPTVAVFGSSRCTPADPSYRDAFRLGALLAEAGFVVANGGYAGVMEAVSGGARKAGGEVVGVTAPAVFPGRSGPNLHLTSEVRAGTISERIHRLVDIADASITMPGSLGTVAEFIVAWNEAFVAPFREAAPKPHLAVGTQWAELVEYLRDRFGADTSHVHCVATVEEAVDEVTRRLGVSEALDRLPWP